MLTGGEGDVQIREAFTPRIKIPVSAGLGPFNTSSAQDRDPLLATYFTVYCTNFLSDRTLVASIASVRPGSTSYLLVGGMGLVSPRPSKDRRYPDAAGFVVKDVASYQLDYGDVGEGELFDVDRDCKTYGLPNKAIRICVAASKGFAEDNRVNASKLHPVAMC